MQALGCILGLIGSIAFLLLSGWRSCADENDENQACRRPVASASCILELGGLGSMDMMRIRYASYRGHVRAHRLHRLRAPLWLDGSGR